MAEFSKKSRPRKADKNKGGGRRGIGIGIGIITSGVPKTNGGCHSGTGTGNTAKIGLVPTTTKRKEKKKKKKIKKGG